MLLLFFNNNYVRDTSVIPYPNNAKIQALRYDDVSLIELIRKSLAENEAFNVNVIDGFPEQGNDSKLVLPTISVEHINTYDDNIGLTDGKNTIREFGIDIFGRSKGERDDLSAILERLYGYSVLTDDGRKNYIKEIEHIDNDSVINIPVDFKRKYYYINFNGNAYGIIPHRDDLVILDFITYLDIFVYDQVFEKSKYIIDKYIPTSKYGHKIYIDSNMYMHFTCGVGVSDLDLAFDFSSYIGKRIQLAFLLKHEDSTITLNGYIDRQLVGTFETFISSVYNNGSKQITIAAMMFNNNYMNHIVMDLYNFKFGNLRYV